MRSAQEVKPASWQDVCSARVKPLSFYNFHERSEFTSIFTSIFTSNLTS